MICRLCKDDKLESEFYPGRKICKDCRIQQVSENRRQHWDEYGPKAIAYYNEKRDAIARYRKRRYEELREEVLMAYGGACVCCGETEFAFLAIDHVNDDGAERRRSGEHASGGAFLYWIKRHGFPDELQVLCHNCNWAKQALGECPHKALVIT